MKNRVLRVILILVVVMINIGCDRFTKNLAVENLRGKETVRLIGNFAILTYAENRGAFLSLGAGLPDTIRVTLLIVLPAALVFGLLLYAFLNQKLSALRLIGVSCIIGGGIGNLYDRIFNGGLVVDFLNFGIGSLRTGILNAADLSVVVGIAFLIVSQPRTPKLPSAEHGSDGRAE